MARVILATALIVALAVSARAFIGGSPERPDAARDAAAPRRLDLPAAEGPIEGGGSGLAAVAAGILVGMLAGMLPASAMASQPLPAFRITRPDYMQGVDASNAAIWKGQVDFVTRSQMEALEFPTAASELKAERAAIRAAPSKAERVERVQQQMRELAAKTDLPA